MRQLIYGETIFPVRKPKLTRQRVVSWAGKGVRVVREAEVQLPPADNQNLFNQETESQVIVEAETVGTDELLES